MTARSDSFADNVRFLKALIARPKNIGAVVPSGPALSRAIARQFDPKLAGPVLELGPGTGVVTAALLERGFEPERITVVEYDPEMARCLTERFPRVAVVEGDAFDLSRTLASRYSEPFSGIISGIPLLNFPVPRRKVYLASLIQHLLPGGTLVQFSYGLEPPVAPPPGFSVSRAATIWANLPPARVWLYTKN